MRITGIGYTFHPDKYVQLSKHVKGMTDFDIHGTTEDSCTFVASIVFDARLGTYTIRSITFEGSDGVPVVSSTLRDVQLGELVSSAIWQRIGGDAPLEDLESLQLVTDRGPAEAVRARIRAISAQRRHKPDSETLEHVAIVYELATIAGAKPVKVIEQDFDIPPRTASHWVKLARERGHLDDA